MTRILALLLTLLLVPGIALARIDRLEAAPAIAVTDASGAPLPAAAVHAAILAGANVGDTAWVVVADAPGAVTLRRWIKGKHMMELTVMYADGTFRADYHDSEQLNYRRNRRGNEYIHPNYFVWRGELEQAIVAAARAD